MNKRTKMMVFVSLIAMLLMISLQACDLRSFVKVDVPEGVATAVDAKPPVTLKEVSDVREDWVFYVESNTKRLDASIEEAEATYAQIHQIVSIGLDTAQTASSGIPYGGILFGALTGLTGLMLPQPKFSRKKE